MSLWILLPLLWNHGVVQQVQASAQVCQCNMKGLRQQKSRAGDWVRSTQIAAAAYASDFLQLPNTIVLCTICVLCFVYCPCNLVICITSWEETASSVGLGYALQWESWQCVLVLMPTSLPFIFSTKLPCCEFVTWALRLILWRDLFCFGLICRSMLAPISKFISVGYLIEIKHSVKYINLYSKAMCYGKFIIVDSKQFEWHVGPKAGVCPFTRWYNMRNWAYAHTHLCVQLWLVLLHRGPHANQSAAASLVDFIFCCWHGRDLRLGLMVLRPLRMYRKPSWLSGSSVTAMCQPQSTSSHVIISHLVRETLAVTCVCTGGCHMHVYWGSVNKVQHNSGWLLSQWAWSDVTLFVSSLGLHLCTKSRTVFPLYL